MYNLAIPVGSVACYINGRPFGWIMACNLTVDTSRNEIRGLDSLLPYELVSGMIQISGTMNILRVRDSGGIEGAGIMALPEYLPQEKYFTLSIVDIITGQGIFKSNYCSVQSQSWNMPSKSIITGHIAFKALTYGNDTSF